MDASDNVVSASQLAKRISQGDVFVIDARFDLTDPARGERDYFAGHIAGAVHAHLDRELADLSKRGEGRHPLPDQATFAATLSRWGLSADRQVVVYDGANGALAAARAWWLLRLAGHTRVAVLDGGIAAWRASGRVFDAQRPVLSPRAIEARFDCHQIVWFEELERRRHDKKSLLIDARAAPRFRGDSEPLDARAGHVPRAVNRPFANNLDADGHFKPPQILRREFDALLDGRDPRDVIHMCGSGVTACHNLLAMEYAGLAGSRMFAPSWSGWIENPERPIATGDA